jgi:hypothetical protein
LPFLYSCDLELRQIFAEGLHAPRNRPQWVVEHERSADMKRDRITKKHNQLARACERAAVPERPFLRGPLRYLVHPNVTAACAPSLRVIAGALREDTLMLDEDELRAVRTFITDGGSPFFGRDATAAMREAVRLQQMIVRREPLALDQERTAIAV